MQEEKDNWENKKSDQVLSIEKNIESLYQQYTAEILQVCQIIQYKLWTIS
jgi:hypothetical protein